MESKLSGVLCGLSAIVFISIWAVLLLVAQPDDIESIKQALSDMLSVSDSKFFYYSSVSILTCIICSICLFQRKFPIQIMYVVLAHAVIGLFVYDWILALVIALPLTLFFKVKKGT